MRTNKFESAGLDPIGRGEEKNVFLHPKNWEGRVISERRVVAEKDTPRELKGRYYLTKIAHLLLPKNIPDVYQAAESKDGHQQTIDSERISHSPGQALLQELRRVNENEKAAEIKMEKELGKESSDLATEIESIGLGGFTPDWNLGNFTKDESGDVYYLETLKPWEVDVVNPNELEVLFKEERLRDAIENIPDQATKEKCNQYLERLLALLEEERKANREKQEQLEIERKANLIDCRPGVEKLETTITPFLEEHILASLHEITSYKTVAEILNNEERNRARAACNDVFSQLKFLQERTNITDEEYRRLSEKHKALECAIGTLNAGIVDHSR